MREKALRVLLVEDNAADVRLLREMFSKEKQGSFELTHSLRMSEAEVHLARGEVDIVLLDMGLPDEHGLDTVRRSLAAAPGVPVIVLTGLDDETLAAGAMKEGAQDYLIKGQIENRALPRALRHAIERHQLDRRLRDQQFYTRSLIESSVDALMTTDPHGIITDVNMQMEALTGCPRDALVGAPFKKYFSDPDRAEAGIKRVLDEGKITDYELTVRALDGNETVVSYNATTFYDRDHRLQGVFAAARDVTERKLFERTLQEKNVELERTRAAAEKANLAKSDFLSSMSHEIRTPMNAILGMADALWESRLDAEQRHYVEVFRRAGASLMVLINNILDLSKIEAGHLHLEHIGFNLEEVVNQAIELNADNALAKGIGLVSRFAPGLLTALIGDPTRLRQVLINLVGNAIKFTESGEVVLTVGNHESRNSGEIAFSISDTGVGIPLDKLEMIFDDFTQADTSTTRRYGGTGLGLGISRRIVQAMGGRLTATTSPGRGSTFRFNAQFEVAKETDRKSPVAPVDLHRNMESREKEPVMPANLLIAEDSRDNRLLFQAYFKGSPYQVTFEEDGKAAVNRFATSDFDLILMDVRMPMMDGLAATRAIRSLEKERGGAAVPIIALTANASLEDLERSHDAGCNAHLSKPITKLELLTAIEKYRRHSKQLMATKPGSNGPIRIELPAGVEDLIPGYLWNRRQEVAEMIEGLAASDFERLSDLGHNLKGTARGYGFPDLVQMGAALEQSANQGDCEALRIQIGDLGNYLDRVELVSCPTR